MQVRIANAPVSWGVFYGDDPTNPPWAKVLDEIAATGHRWTELGPIGFLPEDPGQLAEALAERDLSLIGGFIYEPLHLPAERENVLAVARRTCRALAPHDAKYFVIIDHHSAPRAATTGRSDAAPRLEGEAWRDFMATIAELARIAADHGLMGLLHPHSASYVEFADEIDRALADLDPALVGICADTGHLAYAGVDPIAFYRRHHARTPYFHFKNVDGAARERALADELEFFQAISAGVFCGLPDGVVDFRDLKIALEETGYDGWATIEQDNDPRQGGDPLAEDQVEVVNMGSDMNQLMTGQAQAVTGWLTNTNALKVVGAGRVDMMLWDTGIQLYANPYYVTDKTLDENFDAVVSYLRGSARGWAFVKNNPEQAVDMLVKAYPNLSRESDLEAIGPVLGFSFNEATRAKGWGDMTRANWEEQIRIYADLGQFKGAVPTVDDVMTTAVLDATADVRAKLG